MAAAVKKRPRRALGLHLEGPFLDPTPGARGSHKADRIREPDTALLAELLALSDGTVKLLTVAAGRPGCCALIEFAVAAGVKVALGHQLATLEQLEEVRDPISFDSFIDVHIEPVRGALLHVVNGLCRSCCCSCCYARGPSNIQDPSSGTTRRAHIFD